MNSLLIKNIISAGALFTLARAMNIALMFTFNAILVKLLVKESVGDFFLTLNLVGFFVLVASFGAANVAIKQFSDHYHRSESSIGQILKAFIVLNTGITLVVVCTLYLIFNMHLNALFDINYSKSQLLIVAMWVWAQGLQIILTEFFRAIERFILTILSANLLLNVANLLILVSYFFSSGMISFNEVITFVAINSVLVTAASLVWAVKLSTDIDSNRSPGTALLTLTKQFVIDSTPSFVNKLGLYLTMLADLWVVAIFFSKDVVADYGLAIKLVALIAVFLTIANGFVPTYIGKLKSEGRETVERFLRLVATLVMLPTLIVFMILMFYSEWLITTAFEASYVTATSFISILIYGQLMNVIVGSCNYALVMEGRNTTLMKISIVFGLLAVLVSYSLLSTGMSAIAIAYVFTLALIAKQLSVYLAVRRYCKINTGIYLSPTAFIKNLRIMMAVGKQLDAN